MVRREERGRLGLWVSAGQMSCQAPESMWTSSQHQLRLRNLGDRLSQHVVSELASRCRTASLGKVFTFFPPAPTSAEIFCCPRQCVRLYHICGLNLETHPTCTLDRAFTSHPIPVPQSILAPAGFSVLLGFSFRGH